MSQTTQYTNKREHCVALIEAGGATKQSLIEALETSDKSLASTFALLRLTGKYPMKHEDGTYYFGTESDFNEAKSARVGSGPVIARSPIEALEAATKREDRASKALTTVQKRYTEDASRENELRQIIAEAELELASVLLGKAQAAYEAADPASRDDKRDKRDKRDKPAKTKKGNKNSKVTDGQNCQSDLL